MEVEREFKNPGDRLNQILDDIGFPDGHGRIKRFMSYIHKEDVGDGILKDIPYSTIRSWFSKQTPTMKKMGLIFDTLEMEYIFKHDTERLKMWWKLGGEYPFQDDINKNISSNSQLDILQKRREKKLTLDVMSLVTSGDLPGFDSVESDDVMKVVEKVVQFGRNFSNPAKIECPKEYMKLMLIGYLAVQNSKDEN